MMLKNQTYNSEDIKKAMRSMLMRIRNNALLHIENIDIRTLRILQNLDMFEGENAKIGEDIDLSLLKNSSHPNRISLTTGPLIVYFTEDKKNELKVVDVSLLLFAEELKLRKTVIDYFKKKINNNPLSFTPKTKNIIKQFSNNLVSDQFSDWSEAAVTIYDSINDDILIALQGTRQSLESKPVIQDSLNSFSKKVLYPSTSSFNSIKLTVINPEREHEQITDLINRIVSDANTLVEACTGYYQKLGYIPLAPKYGMAEVVIHWLADHADITENDVWSEIWDWANKTTGPLPRYHACCVFVLYPELIPEGKITNLWNEILSVIRDSDTEVNDSNSKEAFLLRRDLARHNIYHIEARLPGGDGDKIANFAWWLSEQVSTIFPNNPEASRFYRENWVQQAIENSIYIWLTACPYIGRSFLRYISLNVRSPWSVGFLSIMGEKLEQLNPGEQSDEIKEQFHNALVNNALSSLPFTVKSTDDPTYSLEYSLGDTVLKWAVLQSEEEQKNLVNLVTTSMTLKTDDELCKALQIIDKSQLADQLVVALFLKSKVYTEKEIADKVWEIITDSDWRHEVLGNIDINVLALLIESFSILLIYNQGEWSSKLPHYLAELCEITEDEERQQNLFIYVLHTSLASNTYSAVRRLLKGKHKTKFIELVENYRNRFENMCPLFPPWVVGKMRGLMANLHV